MEVDVETIFWLYGSVVETAVLLLLVKWYFFDKKVSKRRPRKKAEVKVTVPTIIKVEEPNDQ